MTRLTTREWMQLPWAHMHGQFSHHSEASIVATEQGLLALKSAIDVALSAGKGEAKVFASDGEGYSIHVERVTFSRLGIPPYLDEIARRIMDAEVEILRQMRRHRERGFRQKEAGTLADAPHGDTP